MPPENLAAIAILLHLGCPADRLDDVLPRLHGTVPDTATEVIALLTAAMRSVGVDRPPAPPAPPEPVPGMPDSYQQHVPGGVITIHMLGNAARDEG